MMSKAREQELMEKIIFGTKTGNAKKIKLLDEYAAAAVYHRK